MKRFFKIKKLIIILIIGVVLVVSIGILTGYFNIVSTKSWGVYKDNIKISNDKVEIQASLTSSSDYIKDYRYNIQKDALYIWIYAAPIFKPDPDKLGQINITIEMDTSTINKIYIRGYSYKDAELIWVDEISVCLQQ